MDFVLSKPTNKSARILRNTKDHIISSGNYKLKTI